MNTTLKVKTLYKDKKYNGILTPFIFIFFINSNSFLPFNVSNGFMAFGCDKKMTTNLYRHVSRKDGPNNSNDSN